MFRPVFNKNVTIDAPADASSFKDVMKDIQEAAQAYYQEQYSDYDYSQLESESSSFES